MIRKEFALGILNFLKVVEVECLSLFRDFTLSVSEFMLKVCGNVIRKQTELLRKMDKED